MAINWKNDNDAKICQHDVIVKFFDVFLLTPPLPTRILHYNVILCVIWYHLYNVKNEKNIHRGVLLLVKVALLHRCFSCVLNSTSGAKFHKASPIMITLLAFCDIVPYSLFLITTHLEIGTPRNVQLE